MAADGAVAERVAPVSRPEEAPAMNDHTTRDGCTLRYRVSGDGPHTVVIVPGWSQTAAMFDRAVALLGPEFRVVSYDHRNHGESGRTPYGARIATLAADLLELLDHLGVERAHVVAHSMGCSVLWSHIDSHGTGRLASVMWIDQPSVCALLPWLAPSDASDVGAILDFAGAEAFVASLLGPDADAVREGFLRSMLSPDLPDDDFAFLLAENRKLAMPYGAQLLMDHVMQDWRDVLPRVDVPSLVVGGEVSHVAASSQAWSAAQMPGATLRVFTRAEGGAHFPFFESPADFVPVLRRHVLGAAQASTPAAAAGGSSYALA